MLTHLPSIISIFSSQNKSSCSVRSRFNLAPENVIRKINSFGSRRRRRERSIKCLVNVNYNTQRIVIVTFRLKNATCPFPSPTSNVTDKRGSMQRQTGEQRLLTTSGAPERKTSPFRCTSIAFLVSILR